MILKSKTGITLLLLLSFLISFGQKIKLENIDLSKIRKDEIVVKIKNTGTPSIAPGSSLSPSKITSLPFSKSSKPILHKPQKKSSCLDGIYIIKINEGEDIIDVLKEFQKYDNIEYAEPIYLENMLLVPDDPMAEISGGSQYYLDLIQAYDAWEISTGNSDIIIGISDTGIDFNHNDIVPKIYINPNEIINGVDDDENGFIDDINGYDFGDEDNDPQCTNSYHGNRVAGLAGAATNNGIGMAGVGYNSKISGLKVFPDGSNLAFAAYEGIVYAADNGYDVINLSWGSASTFGEFNQDIIDYAVLENDLVIIAAGGNSGKEEDFYPASYDHILSVGWTDANDELSPSSTYSYKIDLVAPGVGISSTSNNNGYSSDSGSSFAAPMVAGAAALVKDVYPYLNAEQIMEVLRTSTDDIYDIGSNSNYNGKLGTGRLNVFKALSQDSLRSIRAKEIEYSAKYDNYIFFDDSLDLALKLKSYLLPLQSGQVTFSSPSAFATIGDDTYNISFTDSMQIRSLDFDQIYIHSDTPPETTIPIRMDFKEGSYNDFQYFTFTTSPDYLDIDNGSLALTLSGNGNLAFAEDNFSDGNGLLWNDQNIIETLSLIVGNAEDSVSDNATMQIGSLQRDQDFTTTEYIKFHETDKANFFTKNTFLDSGNISGLGLKIEQKTYAFAEDTLQDFLIIEYRTTNLENDTIRDLSIGMMADWGLGDADENNALRDESTNILYANSGDTIYSGMKWYGLTNTITQSLDLGTESNNEKDIETSLTDSVKFHLISENLFDSAGFTNNAKNDVAQVAGIPAIKLAPYGTTKSAIILATGNSIEELRTNIANAELKYSSILNNPPIDESFTSCNGVFLEIDPSSGTNFRFYSDPLGLELIREGDSLVTGIISSDTSFYIQNIDSLYAEDMQRLEVTLRRDIAQFDQSTDTLYLDHPDINLVSFTDNTEESVGWSWDFNNGVFASTQNPNINFKSPGVHEIILTVETAEGCIDSDSELLIVANRPDQPQTVDLLSCIADVVFISDANGDSIAIYPTSDAIAPIYVGNTTEVIVSNDTTFFISRIENGFQSLRKEVKVLIDTPQVEFDYAVNTESEISSVLFFTQSIHSQTLEWFVDGIFASQNDTLTLEVSKTTYDIKLITTTSVGCKDSLSQTLNLKESPKPEVSFSQPCLNESITISPENGTVFGFYRDGELLDFILKGRELFIESISKDTSIFVVGLDSILASEAIQINISPIRFEFEISAQPEILDLSVEKNVLLSNDSESQNITWFVNGDLISTFEEIEIFFSEPGFQEIVCNGIDPAGCEFSDTLQYEVVEKIIEPLASVSEDDIKLFPNPSKGQFSLSGLKGESLITISNISGETLFTQEGNTSTIDIDLGGYSNGLYLIRINSRNNIVIKHLIIH